MVISGCSRRRHCQQGCFAFVWQSVGSCNAYRNYLTSTIAQNLSMCIKYILRLKNRNT